MHFCFCVFICCPNQKYDRCFANLLASQTVSSLPATFHIAFNAGIIDSEIFIYHLQNSQFVQTSPLSNQNCAHSVTTALGRCGGLHLSSTCAHVSQNILWVKKSV